MKKTLWLLAAIGALLLAAAALRGDAASENAAQEAAKSWLGLIDAGDYAKSWSRAAELFKKQVTAEQWETAARNVRSPLGRVLSRQVRSTKTYETLPGVPDGEYVVIQYDTSFENKKAGIETVTPMKDKDGVWRVSGYFIK